MNCNVFWKSFWTIYQIYKNAIANSYKITGSTNIAIPKLRTNGRKEISIVLESKYFFFGFQKYLFLIWKISWDCSLWAFVVRSAKVSAIQLPGLSKFCMLRCFNNVFSVSYREFSICFKFTRRESSLIVIAIRLKAGKEDLRHEFCANREMRYKKS